MQTQQYQHMTDAMASSGNEAMHVMATIMSIAAMCSLVVSVAPMAWGQVKVKWLVTGLTSTVTFGLTGLMVRALAGPKPDRAPSPPEAPWEIDWHATGLLALAIFGALAAIVGTCIAASAVKRRREAATKRREARMLATSPEHVAQTLAPEMQADVRRALDRIALLKTIGERASCQEDADALVMIDRRMPSIMNRYSEASEISTSEERPELARMALRSIIDIGRMAEEARRRMAGDLRNGLDTETRYVSSRSGDVGDLHSV